MYTLKAKTCFYDKEHPGRMLHPGELLITKDEERVKRLQELNFAEVVTVDQPEAPKEEPVKEPEEVAEVVTVGSESYPVAVVKEALNAIGVKTAANAGLKAVSKKVSELSEEQAQELAKVLTK